MIAMGRLSASAGGDKGSQLRITSPRIGDIMGSTVELAYALEKGTKGDHVHGFVDGQYQKEFKGTLHRLNPGKHQITVTVADHDHALLATSVSIGNAVK